MPATSARLLAWLSIACFLFPASGCKLLNPPLVSAFVYPLLKPATNSLEPGDYRRIVDESALEDLSIGILRPPRAPAAYALDDPHVDESVMLRDYLVGTRLFRSVEIVDDPVAARCDFAISCSADSIRETTLDPWVYGFNWALLGLGFVLGIPYQDTQATYLVEAVFYEVQTPDVELAGASIVFNHRRWYGHNLYWDPDVHGAKSFEPVFAQLLYDFLVESGCAR
ncbi:MAG: hypothetical protein AB7O52_03970 [Planctomycetota bacterium]